MQIMASQQLLLSWKDHDGTLVSVFENFLKKNTLVDCTLAAEGRYLKAHKMVLSACSSYFELLFSQENEKNPIVILKGAEFQELEAAVNFMYKGEVDINEDRLEAFLEVANSLQIKGLENVGKIQNSKEILSSLSIPKILSSKSVSPRQQSKKSQLSSRSDSAGQTQDISVPADCELVTNNESSAVHQTFPSKDSRSRPTLPGSSCLNQRQQDKRSDEDNLQNSERSSTVLPQLTSAEKKQSDINPVFKTEPVADTFVEEKSDEADMDFEDDVKMIDDEEDWDDHNVETMNDEPSTSLQDLGFTSELIKTEDDISENAEGVQSGSDSSSEGASQQDSAQNFSSIGVKDEPSASTSWSGQELYGDAVCGTSTGTPAASTGAEYVVDPERPYSKLSTRSSTQFHDKATSCRSTNIALPAVSREPSLPQQELQKPESKEHIFRHRRNVLSSSLELGKHKRFRDSNQDLKCHYCEYIAVSQWALTTHLRTHKGERPFKCAYCMYASSTKGSLARHIRIHTGEKPYQCRECDYKANNLSSYYVHLRRHSGEKPYQCSQCHYKANDPSNLKQHRRVHSGVKPYQCSECHYKTNSASNLKQHRRIHTGEKPYQCLECDYKAKRAWTLMRHRRIHCLE